MLTLCCQISEEDVLIITDRDCGAEESCRQLGIRQVRIPGIGNREFSYAAAQRATEHGVSALLLLFGRLVTEELFDTIPTFNIHPSLLPSFQGFGAIKQARACGVTLLGATLHEVDAKPDSGRIVSQVTSPIGKEADLDTMQRISFVQKVYLSLVFYEHICGVASGRNTPSASPALCSSGLVAAFRDFLSDRPETVFV